MGTLNEINDTRNVKKKKGHVLFVTVAFAGHFPPYVQLLFHLDAEYPGLTVTVMGNKDRIADLAGLRSNGALEHLDLRLEEVFGPIPVYHKEPKFPVRAGQASDENFRESESFRKQLIAQKDAPGAPTAIVGDIFQCWSKDLADDLGIPWYTMYPGSPAYATVIVEMPKLATAGILDDDDDNRENTTDGTKLLATAVPDLVDVPGLTAVRLRDLPNAFYDSTEFFIRVAKSVMGATALLLNVSEEMDVPVGAVPGLRTLVKSRRVLSIGPSLQLPGFGFIYSSSTDSASKGVLEWLDSQPAKSVLYVSFGSLGTLTQEANLELAAGIEGSGLPFVWALKLGKRQLSDILPPGFLERTRGRGVVETGWLPQSQILLHPATGGFLTHCGWNSTLESICAGVPLLTWPLASDQHINARFVADDAKVAFSVSHYKETDKDSIEGITAREIEGAIRLLMLEEKGRQARANIEAMQKSAQVAVAEGGSSYRNLHTLLDELAGARLVEWPL